MRVKRLNINSFRGIGEMTLELSETEPTVFIGVNGVGKSSILDSLAILLSSIVVLIRFKPKDIISFMVREERGLIRELYDEIEQGREFTQQDIKNGAKKIYEEITISSHSKEIKWSITKTQIQQKIGQDTNFVSLYQFTQDIRTQLKTNHRTNIPLAVYYPVNRSVLDIPLEISANNQFQQTEAYEQSLTGVRIEFSSFFQWFRTVEDLENEELRENSDYRDQRLEAARQAIVILDKIRTLRGTIISNDFIKRFFIAFVHSFPL